MTPQEPLYRAVYGADAGFPGPGAWRSWASLLYVLQRRGALHEVLRVERRSTPQEPLYRVVYRDGWPGDAFTWPALLGLLKLLRRAGILSFVGRVERAW